MTDMKQAPYDLEKILANLKIEALNEMQQASLEANAAHNEVLLLSATGTGKTLAFLLPVLQLLDGKQRHTQALVIVPSRELAQQIEGLNPESCATRERGHLNERIRIDRTPRQVRDVEQQQVDHPSPASMMNELLGFTKPVRLTVPDDNE